MLASDFGSEAAIGSRSGFTLDLASSEDTFPSLSLSRAVLDAVDEAIMRVGLSVAPGLARLFLQPHRHLVRHYGEPMVESNLPRGKAFDPELAQRKLIDQVSAGSFPDRLPPRHLRK